MKVKIYFVIGIFLLNCSNYIFAQNFNDAYRLSEQTVDFDARTLAFGNSSIASMGNFSSAVINPAGLATIKKSLLNFGINTNSFNNNGSIFNSSSTTEKSNNNTNQFGLVFPLPTKKGSAVIAFGYNQSNDYNSFVKFDGFNSNTNSMIQDLAFANDDLAYELYLSYPTYNSNGDYDGDVTNINGRLNQSGSIDEEGSLNSWLMSGAFEISKNIFIGGTLNLLSGEYKRTRTYWEEDVNNVYTGYLDSQDSSTFDFQSFYLNDNIMWDISGFDFRLGLLYKMNDMLNFGATIKFPTSYTILETYSVYGESEFANAGYYVDYPGEEFEYKISTPMELSGGISASLPFVNLNASLKFIDYSQLEFTDGFDEIDLDTKNAKIVENLENVVNYNFGAEVTFPYPAMKLRGGFIYNPSPYIGDASDYDKKYFTAGLGLPLSKNLIIDFAYLHGWWNNFGDNYGTNLSRINQEITLNKFGITVNYIFM
ncbi:MAG: outer membrane protein transport protein [Ignavibacteriae bacterium]|nr:outer membrane protein transport protein [Ignavibacteriota bacterium]